MSRLWNDFPIQYKKITKTNRSENDQLDILTCKIVEIKDSWLRPARKIALCNGIPEENISCYDL